MKEVENESSTKAAEHEPATGQDPEVDMYPPYNL